MALTIVTIAESIVNPIIMQTLILVDVRMCSFQKAIIGTTANTISVSVVYALTQYEKPLKISGLQHLPLSVGFHNIAVGLH